MFESIFNPGSMIDSIREAEAQARAKAHEAARREAERRREIEEAHRRREEARRIAIERRQYQIAVL